ncbi:DUF4145 domain-containing protein [Variovorax rhizosphaerae]|uniref:DUF4145 domain-containing protein n=1 Tax=Variovorax rhizosphaerae TaxID=1836200 RepID=A0ABU8X1B5_9BURK
MGVEAKFARGAKEALAEVEAIEATEAPPVVPHVEPPFDPNAPVDDPCLARIHLIDPVLVATSPKAAVMLGRANIEAAVKRLSMREGTLMPKGTGYTFTTVLYALQRHGVIPKQVVHTALELYKLGSKAVHGDFEPNVDAAKDYVEASEKVVRLLLRPPSESTVS